MMAWSRVVVVQGESGPMWEVMGGPGDDGWCAGAEGGAGYFWGLACVTGWLVVPCTEIRSLEEDECGGRGGFGWYRLLVRCGCG